VEVSELRQKLTRTVRTAVEAAFDQSKPFGRLALVHTLLSAGTTAVTVGLAGTLFFSISPKAAESKVLLYLLITVAPFAVVAPALSPLLDRGRQARRSAVVIATGGSALLCIAMMNALKDLLLFPECLGFLVLSKLYLIARAALVPAIAQPGEDLATINAHLQVLSALAGFAISPVAVAFLQINGAVVMGLAAVIFAAATVGAFRLPRVARAAPPTPAAPARPPAPAYGSGSYGPGVATSGASASAAPATTAGYSGAGGYAGAAGGISGYAGGGGGAAGGAAAGGGAGYSGRSGGPYDRPITIDAGLPGLGPAPVGDPPPGPYGRDGDERISAREAKAQRKSLGLGRHHPAVLSGFTAMCVVRGSVGFVTFFLAFALKRADAAAWWYGFILLASGVGGLAGSAVVPWARRRMSEERIILAALVLGAVFAVSTALIGGMWAQPLLTFVIGLAGTTAKPSFDSLVQREVPALMQGRAFARFETWLQLVWVAAALLAVLIDFRLVDGDVVVGVSCGIAAFFYATMRHTAHRHDAQAHAGV
jgi:hypothetical protein